MFNPVKSSSTPSSYITDILKPSLHYIRNPQHSSIPLTFSQFYNNCIPLTPSAFPISSVINQLNQYHTSQVFI